MTGQLVLLTGGSGHVGYRTLIEALSKGYRVRAAVRSQAKVEEITAAEQSKPYLDSLSFDIVPSIEEEGAFDEALRGVDHVVHIASPLPKPSDDDNATIVQPAIRGTMSILNSALKVPSIKKVVITSSAIAILPEKITGPFTADEVYPNIEGPFPNAGVAYVAAKKMALNGTRAFIAQKKPHFSVINVMPSYVIGPNYLAKTPAVSRDGSNRMALGVIFGDQNPDGAHAAPVHIDDVAFVHIASLDPKVEGNHNFGANWLADGWTWDDAIEIVKKHFPKEVEAGMFPFGGHQTAIPAPFDASKTEEVLGFKFKGFEQQVVDAVGHYARLAAATSFALHDSTKKLEYLR